MSEKRADRTRGSGHDTFWAYCAAGELRIQKCTDCGGMTWPVAPTCEHCDSAALTWERMSGNGKVLSWCQFHQDYYRGAPPVPYDCILVDLAERVPFISNPKGFGYDDIEPGMAVQLAFIDCEDSAGPFKLPVFERA